MSYQPDETHLEQLLSGARLAIARQTLHGQRQGAFQILDYYTATLKQAGSAVGRDVESLGLGELVDLVLAYIPGLRDLDFLRGLRNIRNQLFHDERYSPRPQALTLYVEKAAEVREALRRATDDYARRVATLDPLSRRFFETSEGIRRHLPSLSQTWARDWENKADRAVGLSKTPVTAWTADDIGFLLDATARVASWDGYNEAMGEHGGGSEPEDSDWEIDHSPEPGYDPRDWDEAPHYNPDQEPAEREPDDEPPSGHDEDPSGPEPDEGPHEPQPDEDAEKADSDEKRDVGQGTDEER